MAKLLLIFIVALHGLSGLGFAQEFAWWISARFEPRDQTVEGLPLRDIDTEWSLASALDESDLPPEAEETGDSPQQSGASMALEADLDGDGSPEKAVVG